MHSITVTTDQDQQVLQKASDYVDETIGTLREIAYNLLPNSLTRNNLIIALKEYIYKIPKEHNLLIEFNCPENTVVPKEIEIHLFRILQEIIQNTIKHAKASTLTLFISNEQTGLYLATQDNGVGFETGQRNKAEGGLGLRSIESRCELIHANLRIISEKNKGCQIIIQISQLWFVPCC